MKFKEFQKELKGSTQEEIFDKAKFLTMMYMLDLTYAGGFEGFAVNSKLTSMVILMAIASDGHLDNDEYLIYKELSESLGNEPESYETALNYTRISLDRILESFSQLIEAMVNYFESIDGMELYDDFCKIIICVLYIDGKVGAQEQKFMDVLVNRNAVKKTADEAKEKIKNPIKKASERSYRDLEYIDEKEYLEEVIEKDIPLVEEVFGKISQQNGEVYIEFRDPTVNLSSRLKTFKRRFIAIPTSDVNYNDINLPVHYDRLSDTRIPSQMKRAFLDSIVLNADRTETALLTFKYSKEGINLDLTINAQYETSFSSGKVAITEIERFYHKLHDKEVYLITIEIDFSKVRLINKIFDYTKKPKEETLSYLHNALYFDNDDFIPLIVEELNLYKQIDDVFEEIQTKLIAYSALEKNIYGYWYLLKLGASLDVIIDGTDFNTGESSQASLIELMVQTDKHKHLALSIWDKPDYEFVSNSGQYPAMVAASKMQHEEISPLTFLTFYRILCGDDNIAIRKKSDKALDDLAKLFE